MGIIDTTKQLGKRIQTLRKQKGLTQSQLAGIDDETISIVIQTCSNELNATFYTNEKNMIKALKNLYDLINIHSK